MGKDRGQEAVHVVHLLLHKRKMRQSIQNKKASPCLIHHIGKYLKRRRSKNRFMNAMREDMAVAEVTEEDAEDRNKWRWKMYCGDP